MSVPTARFVKKLEEQLGFIDRSCEGYDKGHEEEAIRIAAALRIIFHQTDRSTSLTTHLGMQEQRMLSSGRGVADLLDFVSVRFHLSAPHPIRLRPNLKPQFRDVSLQDWWKSEPVFVHESKPYSRRKIVLSVANTDGGAHVAKALESYYESLKEGNRSFGFTGNLTFNGPEPFKQGVTHYPKNGHLAVLRQFGYETLASAARFNLR